MLKRVTAHWKIALVCGLLLLTTAPTFANKLAQPPRPTLTPSQTPTETPLPTATSTVVPTNPPAPTSPPAATAEPATAEPATVVPTAEPATAVPTSVAPEVTMPPVAPTATPLPPAELPNTGAASGLSGAWVLIAAGLLALGAWQWRRSLRAS